MTENMAIISQYGFGQHETSYKQQYFGNTIGAKDYYGNSWMAMVTSISFRLNKPTFIIFDGFYLYVTGTC